MRRRPLLGWMVVCVSLATLGSAGCVSAGLSPPRTGQTFTANGVKLWFDVLGEKQGVPLVLINGGPGFDHSYLLTSDVWEELADRRPVVVYDQRGTGRSEPYRKGSRQRLEDHVADLDALRAALGVTKIDLFGHSWGGYLGMAYAVKYPEHTSHLILCDSAAPRYDDTLFLFNALYPDAMERHAKLDALREGGDEKAGDSAILELLRTMFVSKEKRDEFLSKNKQIHLNYPMNLALEADIATHDMWPSIEGLTVPTLVLAGRFDSNVGPETAWKIHKAIAGSSIVFFEQSGHFPFFEEPERFASVVESFLDEH